MSASDKSVGALALVSSKELLDAMVGKKNVNITDNLALRQTVRGKLDVMVAINGRDIEKLKPAISDLYRVMFPGTWNKEDDARKIKANNKAIRAEGKARRAEAKAIQAEAEAKAKAEAKPEAEAEAEAEAKQAEAKAEAKPEPEAEAEAEAEAEVEANPMNE